MAMLYRRVEIVDGETIESVHFVGIHPIAWMKGDRNKIIDIAAFMEIEDDVITDLLEACKAIVRAEKGNALDLWAAVDMAREAIAKAEGKHG